MSRSRREPLLLLGIVAGALAVSSVNPYDRVTWLLEVLPVLIAASILVATYVRFPLTPLLYRLLFLHALILIVGGHYTYARVPVGFWVQDFLDLSRNHYDRLGHLAQGFIPAILAREILVRCSPLRPGSLASSAFYEFIEWWASLIGGESAESFLGTQGDVWDTQWDMFLALLGCTLSQLLLSRRHDMEMARLKAERQRPQATA